MEEEICFEVSAMAVVVCNGKILTTNEMVSGKNILSLPKGHQEKDEDLLQTAIRECFEETNVIIEEKDYVQKLTPFIYKFLSQDKQLIEKINHPYLFKIDHEGNPKTKEEKIIAVRWMDMVEFKQICAYANIKKVIDEAIEIMLI